MLTNKQKAMIKRAQREAALSDEEYREALQTVTGARSSTEPQLGNFAFDRIMAYLEAIYFLKVHKGELQHVCNRSAVFQQKGFWAARNTRKETSRDRFIERQTGLSIAQLEQEMEGLGYNRDYCQAIRDKVTKGRSDSLAVNWYRAALQRTLASKQRKAEQARSVEADNVPF